MTQHANETYPTYDSARAHGYEVSRWQGTSSPGADAATVAGRTMGGLQGRKGTYVTVDRVTGYVSHQRRGCEWWDSETSWWNRGGRVTRWVHHMACLVSIQCANAARVSA